MVLRVRRKYSKEQYEQALNLHHEFNLGYAEIGKRLKIDRNMIRCWCLGINKPYSAYNEQEIIMLKKIRSNAKLGSKNPMWKDDKCSIRTAYERAERWYGSQCPEGCEIHHKDGNPWNNHPDNIEFVTRRHHMKKDGRLDKLTKRNKNPTEETRRNMSLAHQNRAEISEETREKMRQNILKRKRDERGKLI